MSTLHSMHALRAAMALSIIQMLLEAQLLLYVEVKNK